MRYELHHGDCLDILPEKEADSIDTIITDPPYGLSFMGKDWDHGVPGARFWREALRVAKPGAMLLAFGGTRTHHRLMVAIEDAGWEIRDVIMWVYGSGFPKSHDISKAIDKAAGAEREVIGNGKGRTGQAAQPNGSSFSDDNYQWPGKFDITAPATDAAREWHGYGTALKPAYEPIIVAMKPLDGTFANNALTWGVAGLWVDGGRVGHNETLSFGNGTGRHNGQMAGGGENSHERGAWSSTSGRWPANLIHDGSDEVLAGFPVTGGGSGNGPSVARHSANNGTVAKGKQYEHETMNYGDTGSAARFFYCAKASRSERNAGLEGLPERQKYAKNGQGGSHEIFTSESANDSAWAKKNPNYPQANHHPTVKPLALMRYLARITRTPAGGVVLDPFMGSGSTGMAALLEGRRFVGIELDADYIEIARRRLEHAASKPVQPALFSNGAHQP